MLAKNLEIGVQFCMMTKAAVPTAAPAIKKGVKGTSAASIPEAAV